MSLSVKCFIANKDATKFRPLCVFLPKMRTYRKDFHETQYMYFLIKDELLEKYNEIGKKLKLVSKKNLTVIFIQ